MAKLSLDCHMAAMSATARRLTARRVRGRWLGMFYRPDQPDAPRAGLLNALVLPRPIGWISSLDSEGRANLAPYSFFNLIAYRPPQVMFSTAGPHERGGLKNSLANITATREFVVNLATWALREAVNATSIAAPAGYDEFVHAGLTKAPAVTVRPPRVAESPVHLECVLTQLVELESPSPEEPNRMVIGRVTGVHVADAVFVDGRVDPLRLDAISRLGYDQYGRLSEVFTQTRPRWSEPAA